MVKWAVGESVLKENSLHIFRHKIPMPVVMCDLDYTCRQHQRIGVPVAHPLALCGPCLLHCCLIWLMWPPNRLRHPVLVIGGKGHSHSRNHKSPPSYLQKRCRSQGSHHYILHRAWLWHTDTKFTGNRLVSITSITEHTANKPVWRNHVLAAHSILFYKDTDAK